MRFAFVPLTAAVTMGILVGCTEPQAPLQERNPDPVTLVAENRLPDGTVLPVGTVLSDARDETGRPFLRFRLPEGYKLVSMTRGSSGADVQLYDEGGLTCTCKAGSGCSPFKAEGPGGTVTGCAMSSRCTKCLGEVQPTFAGKNGLVLRRDQEVDILNMKAGISFIVSPDELASLSCPRGVVLHFAGFTDGVARFLDGYQLSDRAAVRAARSRSELPESYTMMYVNVYGKAMRLPIQRGITISEVIARNTFLARAGGSVGDPVVSERGAAPAPTADGETTCQCLTGGSGCK